MMHASDEIGEGYYAWKAVKGGAPHALRINIDRATGRREAFLNDSPVDIDDKSMLFARKVDIGEYDRLRARALEARPGSPESDPYVAADPATDEPPF